MTQHPNPFPGPRSFEEADHENFFGRRGEVKKLSSLAISRRMVLLYAASGAGKSSLLQAGLLPRLRDLRDAVVLPIGRVGGELPPDIARQTSNVYVLSSLLDLAGEDADGAELARMSLVEGWGHILNQAGSQRKAPHFLVLDQFEELFTTHEVRPDDRLDFFRQLRDAMERFPQITLILGMREDYIARVDPYRGLLPDHLRTRLRLDLLSAEAARDAIQAPARRAGVTFLDEATEMLIDDLRTRHRQADDGTRCVDFSPHVEPVQLQVVCRRLWERRPPRTSVIDPAQIEQIGQVDQVLADYYADQVAKAAADLALPERRVRQWISHNLITEHGFRGLVLNRVGETGGLPNEALRRMVDTHLVRAGERRGVTWYELTHDRLIEPIQRDNAKWLDTHLSMVERQIALWEKAGRPADRLLLAGENLIQAEHWAAEQEPLSELELAFLDACRQRRIRARRKQRGLRRLRAYATAATLFFLVAVVTLFSAHHDRGRLSTQHLALEARHLQEDQLDLALLLSLEVERRGDAFTARRLLFEGLDSNTYLEKLLRGHDAEVHSVAWSHDGRALATGDAEGTVLLWDSAELRPAAKLRGPPGGVASLAWSHDGRVLAVAGKNTAGENTRDSASLILLWLFRPPLTAEKLAARVPQPETSLNIESRVNAIRFSPNDRVLAAAREDHVLQLWPISTEDGTVEIGLVLTGAPEALTSVAWSPDGQMVAAGCRDHTVRRWNVATGNLIDPALEGHTQPVTSVVWKSDGLTLASASLGGAVRLWDSSTGKQLGWPLDSLVGPVAGLAWSRDGNTLAVGGIDGRIVFGDVATQRPRSHSAGGQMASLRSVDLHPDGNLLASGNGRVIALWKTSADHQLGRRDERHRQPDGTYLSTPVSTGPQGLIPLWLTSQGEDIQHVALSADGLSLASASHGRIWLWDIEQQAIYAGPFTGHADPIVRLFWGPGDTTLVSVDSTGTRIYWDVDPASWRRRACYIAHRELTVEEKRRFLSGTSSAPLCSD